MTIHLHAFYLNFTLLAQIGFIDISFSCPCYICGNIPYNKRLKFIEDWEFGEGDFPRIGGGGDDLPNGGEIPRDIAPGGQDP